MSLAQFFPEVWCSLGYKDYKWKMLWAEYHSTTVLHVIWTSGLRTKYGYNSCHCAHNPVVSKYRQRGLSFLSLPPVHPCVMTDPWEGPFVGNWAYLIFKIPGALMDNKNVPILGYIFLAEAKQHYAQKQSCACWIRPERRKRFVFFHSLTFLWLSFFFSSPLP